MNARLLEWEATPIIVSGWAFSPGPEMMDGPMDSQLADEIVQHPAYHIAAALLALPGAEAVHSAVPSWYQWKARWEKGNRFIELDMSVFEDDETWGGSGIEAECLVEDILAVWSFLQSKYLGVWLHAPDCTLHTQRSFLKEVARESERSSVLGLTVNVLAGDL